MKWFNALGLLLQFISFWLAAPEIIGNEGLKRLNLFLKKLVSNLSLILLTALILAYGFYFAGMGIIRGLEASSTGVTGSEMTRYYVTLGFATLIYLIFLINFRKIKTWLDVHLASPLVNKFIHNVRFRRNALLAGALLFTFGFIIQFIVILIQ